MQIRSEVFVQSCQQTDRQTNNDENINLLGGGRNQFIYGRLVRKKEDVYLRHGVMRNASDERSCVADLAENARVTHH